MTRMKELGYENVDTVESHFGDDKLEFHAGDPAKCKRCRKVSNRSKKDAPTDKPTKQTEESGPGKIAEVSEEKSPKEGDALDEMLAEDAVPRSTETKADVKDKEKKSRRGRPKGSKNKKK